MDKQVLQRAVEFIDSWLAYRSAQVEMPGFAVAIAHDGVTVLERAYGFANLEKRIPMKTDHLFRIASHSKTFAATAVMQLAEKGKLNIDEPMVKHIEWLRKHKDPRMAQITPRQVMSHSAGLIRDGLESNWWQLTVGFPDLEQLKKEVLKSDLIFDNNQEMKYSNTGYALLGCLIEEVSGISFNEYIRDNIIDALRLSDTHPDYSREFSARLATGYSRRDAQKERLPIAQEIEAKAMASAGGVCSNLSDMCEYFGGHFVGNGKLLNDETKKEMQRTQWRLKEAKDNEEYGLGLEIDYAGSHRLFGHGGAFPGYRTRSLCDPQDKLVIVVLTNAIDGEAKDIAKGIFFAIDHFSKSAEDCDPAKHEHLCSYQGRFTDIWGDIDIVEHGRKLLVIEPQSWFPFGFYSYTQTLEPVDDRTWKIATAGGYYSRGELVKYYFNKDGTIKSVRYAGREMLPEHAFAEKMEKLKKQQLALPCPV
ncbi:MAG TPA: serine hydrolase domain-containing protein [Planktothrix sp.]